MQKFLFLFLAVFVISFSADAASRRFVEPRSKGIPQHGTWHRIGTPDGRALRSQVFHDHRSLAEVRRDPHIVMFNHAGWHPVGHWDHWYRDWGIFWRINDWSEIQSVTCEAVDTQTELLYPVTETRAASVAWNSLLVNNVAARALDECAAEAGQPDRCALVERECWNSIY
jgi:hypothetical protein